VVTCPLRDLDGSHPPAATPCRHGFLMPGVSLAAFKMVLLTSRFGDLRRKLDPRRLGQPLEVALLREDCRSREELAAISVHRPRHGDQAFPD